VIIFLFFNPSCVLRLIDYLQHYSCHILRTLSVFIPHYQNFLNMVTISITGGNGDVGTEASKQLSALDEVTKIYLTCRSKEKAEGAIDNLVKITGKDPSFFGYILLDVMDITSIKNAIKDFPKVDRLCLNIGGLANCKIHEASGAVDAMVMNTLGQVVLANGLIDAKKVAVGGRIIFVGSEVSRSVYSFSGLLPDYSKFEEEDIDNVITTVYNDCLTGALPVRSQLGDYKNSKIIGQLYFSHMAKVYPEYFFMTVSPGKLYLANYIQCPQNRIPMNPIPFTRSW